MVHGRGSCNCHGAGRNQFALCTEDLVSEKLRGRSAAELVVEVPSCEQQKQLEAGAVGVWVDHYERESTPRKRVKTVRLGPTF